jgi:DNA-damage-inducible protein J
MNQSILSVRVNKTDKENFEKFCSEAGMNVSTAINMFIKATNRERKLPFEVKTQSYEDYVIEKLKEAEEHYENGARTYTQEEVMEMIKNKLKK